MKPAIHHKPVNGPFEDPSVYVRFLWEKRAVLLDAGDIGRLRAGDMQKLSDLFISHAHIDHFIGFDTVLRALLRRTQPLRVFGPRGIIECIEGKLAGYTWNLVEDYPLGIEAFAVDGGVMRGAGFFAGERFRRKDLGEKPFSGTLISEAAFSVRAAELDHDIPCLGFAIEENSHINIDKAALARMGLPVGPWLSELKKAIRENAPGTMEFSVLGKVFTLDELRPLAVMTRGQKICYVSDAAPTEDNIAKIIALAESSDAFYCEAYFLDEDRDRAVERSHLTAKIAGRIARLAGVRSFAPPHFSPRYMNAPHNPGQEALEEFQGGLRTPGQ